MTFTEYKTVEKEILDCLTDQHLKWRYEPGDQVTAKYRGGDEQEMLLIPILRTKLTYLPLDLKIFVRHVRINHRNLLLNVILLIKHK